MRKFLLPIINLVNLILVSISWGLSGKTAVLDAGQQEKACGNMYQLIWGGSHGNVLAIGAFCLFCVACFLTLVAFLPVKWRKFVSCTAGLFYVATGVLFLLSPKTYDYAMVEPKLSGAFIAINVLILVAGAFSLGMAALEFLGKKESK